MLTRVGVVIIGRNEGERLQNCIKSLVNQASQLVYVDSGSTDNSVSVARQLGAEVVALDMSIPFTAARARNEGFALLKKLYPHVEFVQFVDGDCEVVSTWIERAIVFLDMHIEVAATCGRRRERFPDKTIYNKLCDIEWNTPIGETKACGGDVLMRVIAFENAGGYRADLIAGEEPELCVRYRAAGWKIWRLDEEMTLHDAAMTRFSQWWKRTMRAGHAFAEGAYLHGAPPEKHWVSETRRAWVWGFIIPMFALILMFICIQWGLLFLLIYPFQITRIALSNPNKGKISWVSAFFLVLGKFPEMLGQFKFYQRLRSGKQGRLIEYK
ncbi:MAG TPA: glycosyltransferase family A protein [Methylotenera sp.]|nr:glycosyltransferase family A protein [Methylotenera sp.]HPH06338.1 glycosyltransferase family A protein [Methylotenera sp.]HPN00843.1 glycosyltransferase family A protein [Methylotenera sp.]